MTTRRLQGMLADIRYTVFNDDDSGAGGAASGADPNTSGGGGTTTETPPSGDDGENKASTNGKALTQEQVNKLLADERRKHQEHTKKAIGELEALKQKAQLTQKERDDLDKRISQMHDEMLTKEELAKKEQDRLRKAHETQVKELTSDRDSWRDRFTDAAITRSITDAAAKNEAFNPLQIVRLLQPDTRLVEELDKEQQPTGKFVPKVRFNDVNKEGEPVVLELTPTEAVKRMREMDDYLNLFKGEGIGGLGQNNQPGSKKPDLKELAKDPEAYRKARAEGKIKF